MWAYSPQNRQNWFLVEICQKGYTPLSGFYKNLAWEDLRGLHPHVKFYRCGFKNVGSATKIKKPGIFWYIFAPKEYIPLSNFYKIWRGGGAPKSPQSR